MGKKSRKGKSRANSHTHHKTGEGTHSHHKLHDGSYWKSRHSSRKGSRDFDEDENGSPPEQPVIATSSDAGVVVDVDNEVEAPKAESNDNEGALDVPLVATASTESDVTVEENDNNQTPNKMEGSEEEEGEEEQEGQDDNESKDDDDDDDVGNNNAVAAAGAVGVTAAAAATTAAVLANSEDATSPPASTPAQSESPPTETQTSGGGNSAEQQDGRVETNESEIVDVDEEAPAADQVDTPAADDIEPVEPSTRASDEDDNDKEEIVDVDKDPEEEKEEESSSLLGWSGAFAAVPPPSQDAGNEEEVHFEHPPEEEDEEKGMIQSETVTNSDRRAPEEAPPLDREKKGDNFFVKMRNNLQELGRKCSPYQRYITIGLLFCVFLFILIFVVVSNNNDDDVEYKSTDHHGLGGDGDDKEEMTPWNSSGSGLTLKVLTSLDIAWLIVYRDASKAWDNGYPDAVSITAKPIPFEDECTLSDGFLKICNGDYGPSGWLTINDYVVKNGRMVSNSARINDHYLGDPEKDESETMEYAMCHVLGHGLGLGHVENYPELGECLTFGRDTRNYELLYHMYGLVPGAEPFPPPDVRRMAEREMSPSSKALDARDDNHLRGSIVHDQSEELGLRLAMDKLYDSRRGERLQPEKWRLLHRTEHSELHEVDLSSTHQLRVSKLLA